MSQKPVSLFFGILVKELADNVGEGFRNVAEIYYGSRNCPDVLRFKMIEFGVIEWVLAC